jgi:hypothetical protein
MKFKNVVGVPICGLRLAKALKKYCINEWGLPGLICDDVLTTGGSMKRMKIESSFLRPIGVVIFARGKCPSWIEPVFQLKF